MSDLTQRLRAATEGVTPGPWTVTEWGINSVPQKYPAVLEPEDGRQYDEFSSDSATICIKDEDAAFIAAARQLVPEAADALDVAAQQLAAKEAEIARLREALEKIAKTYPADQSRLIHSSQQIAEVARAALAGKE